MILRTPVVVESVYVRETGRLYGTVAIEGTPDTYVRRKVQLFEALSNPSGLLLPAAATRPRTKTSNVDGGWEFLHLDPASKYHVVAVDHTGQFDPVIKMNLIPTAD